jgi:hypothetical protein
MSKIHMYVSCRNDILSKRYIYLNLQTNILQIVELNGYTYKMLNCSFVYMQNADRQNVDIHFVHRHKNVDITK